MFDELTDVLALSNPLGFDETDAVEVYTFKLKEHLTSIDGLKDEKGYVIYSTTANSIFYSPILKKCTSSYTI